MHRMIFHLSEQRLTFAADFDGSALTCTYAAAHPNDQFTRKLGFDIVTARLDVGSNINFEIKNVDAGDSLARNVFSAIRNALRNMDRREIRKIPSIVADSLSSSQADKAPSPPSQFSRYNSRSKFTLAGHYPS